MSQENSTGALNVSPFKIRFADAPWFHMLQKEYVLLLGAGGISSWVAFLLSRIGVNFSIYDFDRVGSENLGGQLYGVSHIGMDKTTAIRNICTEFCGNDNSIDLNGRYTEDSPSNPVVIAGFDNMSGRKLAFEKWVELLNEAPEEEKDNFLFIDGRLLAFDYQIYTVTKDRIEQYKQTLFEDSEVEEVMCTLKSTTHCSVGIASDIIGVLTNWATNKVFDEDMYEVPFSIVKSIPSFTYNVS